MNMLKDIWADLVDKRLWPVALILVGALVAVPLVLAKPAPDAAVAPAPQATASAAPQTVPGGGAPVSDVSGTAYVGPVNGAAKDPFRPKSGSNGAGGEAGGSSAFSATTTSMPGIVASAGSGSSGSTAASGSTGSAGSGSTGSGSTGSGSTGSPTIPGVPSVKPNVVAALQFGLLGGARTYRRVAELTPLPSPTSPVVVYLGQTRRGESAFLVSAEVTPRGQGRCTPSRGVCSTLYLKPGQVEYLTAQTTAGRQIRYRLKFIERVKPVKVTAPAPSAG